MKKIGVEGLIGVGKSTFCQVLARVLGAILFMEPVEENPWLERFYSNPEFFAYFMQLACFISRTLFHQKAEEHNGVSVLDRSLFGDWALSRTNYKLGNMSEADYAAYEANRIQTLKRLIPLDVLIFLRASPETCLDRIKRRARGCEVGITLDYLRALEENYDWVLERVREEYPTVKIIDVHWTEEFEKNTEQTIQTICNMVKSSPGRESPLCASAAEEVEVYE